MNNKFEQHLKQSLDNYQAKYDPAHWEDMNKRLDKLQAGKSSSLGKTIGIAAGVVATAGLIYFFSTNNSENKQTTQTNTTTQNVTANNNEAKQNIVEPKEQNAEVKNEKSEVKTNNNSKKETTVAENKTQETKAQEVKENPVVNNTTTQNNAQVQQQNPVSESQNSQAAFSAAFHCQNSVCAGAQVEFTADNAKVPCTYKWDFGDGKTSAETNPKHVYAKVGTYAVKLHLTSAKDKTSDEQKNTVTVNSVPNIDMNYSMPDDNNPSLVSFEAKDGSVKEWNWSFGDKQTSSMQNPSHEFKKGSWDVIVTATNTSGCSSTARKMVTIENEFPLASNAFSPTNKDGINDYWMPVSLANGDYSFKLTVYNINGNEVFKTSDKNDKWYGENVKVSERYTWKASVKDKSGKESNYSGIINIVD